MGSLAFFFFSLSALEQGKAKKKTRELRPCARPSWQKLWRVDRTFLFFRSELRAGVRPSLQKLRRVDRTFLFFRSELRAGVRPSLQRLWREREVGIADFSFFFFFFFLCLRRARRKKKQRTSGRCQAELTEIAEGPPHFSFFFRSEPGTGARRSWQKMWRERQVLLTSVNWWARWPFFFFSLSVLEQGKAKKKKTRELRAGARPSWQKLWRVDRTFPFFSGIGG